MGKGGKTQKTTTTNTAAPDAASQAYIDQLRQQAQTAAGVAQNSGPLFGGAITPEQIQAAMNPYISNVVDATQGQYDQLRANAMNSTNQEATNAGAFGGSRAAVTAGARLGQLDQGQAQTIASLLQGGYGQAQQFAQSQAALEQQKRMEPLFRQQQALQFMNLGMGPVGMSSTGTSNVEEKNTGFDLGQAIGLGLTGYGIYQQGKGGSPPASGFQPWAASPYIQQPKGLF